MANCPEIGWGAKLRKTQQVKNNCHIIIGDILL